MEALYNFERAINGFVWGWPMIALLVGTGVLLTVVTGFVQVRRLPFALREVLGNAFDRGAGSGHVTPFQAMAASLGSTVGVGSIAGVATAIFIGGPGAMFWLWVSGILAMATRYAEVVTAVHFREPDETGRLRAGAMYTLTKGLRLPWLATSFAALTALAAFGIGNMVPASAAAASLTDAFGLDARISAVLLIALTGAVIVGGIRPIGEVTSVLVPFMALVYLGGGFLIILLHVGDLPRVLANIFDGAFNGAAATGGFLGATMMQAMRFGIARGPFSNEPGLGMASMIHAAARTDHPVRQGLYGIFEMFVDTILICTASGLAILLTDTWTLGADGTSLAARAFETGLPGTGGSVVVTLGIALFAYSAILSWSYCGETGIVYLLGARAAMPYRVLWLVAIYFGATGSLSVVWGIADTLNGLMVLPNLVAVLGSMPLLLRLQKQFFEAEMVKRMIERDRAAVRR